MLGRQVRSVCTTASNVRHEPARGVVRVAGDDAEKFLQGLVSNNIKSEGVKDRHRSAAVYTGFFSHKGRYLFDGFVARRPHDFLIDVERSAVDALLKHLQRYRLRSHLMVEDMSERMRVQVYTSADRNALACVLAAPTTSTSTSSSSTTTAEPAVAFVDPRLPALGVRTIAPIEHTLPDIAAVFSEIGAHDEFPEVWRMLNGIPRYNVELIADKSIPLEFNLDWLNGISFDKGCYLGQELIARTHFRGVIRKRLVPVFLSEGAPKLSCSPLIPPAIFDPTWPKERLVGSGQQIRLGEEKVGKLLSNTRNIGLAMIRTKYLFGGDATPRIFSCEGVSILPSIPSWWITPTVD